MNEAFLAIINPAAGGGRCRDQVGAALERLRNAGLAIETVETSAAGEATRLARSAYGRGYRKFIAVGGDGTSYEIVNGLFPASQAASSDPAAQIPTLGFLPLGTGNSFLRDFGDPKASDRGLQHAMQSFEARRSRTCDVFRLMHKQGTRYYINLASIGFAADVAAMRHRRFMGLGQGGLGRNFANQLCRIATYFP